VSAKRCLCLLVVVLGALGAAIPADAERNRQLLEQWRQDPEHAARLQRDLRAFYALPKAQQERIRRLDRRLHELDPVARRRLWTALQRYVAWVESLPEDDRQRLAAAEPSERLPLIRQIRDRQFMERLPERVRQDLLALPEDRQRERLRQLRQEEQQRRRELRRLARLPLPAGSARPPTSMKELPPDVHAHVQDRLLPRLSPQENQRLHAAEGKPAVFMPTLAALNAAHPYLPPSPTGRVVRYVDLPWGAKIHLPKGKLERSGQWKALAEKIGRWPDFALAFVELVPPQQRRGLPPLGASRPVEFPSGARPAIEGLTKQLSPEEARRLHDVEGHWPDYPLLLLDLARKHKVQLPGVTPPGPREWWKEKNSQ
jgi:hypothetical protein